MNATVEAMLDNHEADSWRDLSEGTEFGFDNERLSPLERLDEYVDYCFETYPIVSNHLHRGDVQTCVADWDRRRGLHKADAKMAKRTFGKRVVDSKHRKFSPGQHVVFLASPLIGIPPDDDKGVGWKATTRHELGHAIDHAKRGRSDHSAAFKQVMAEFGEQTNDGTSVHGYAPSHFK